MLVINRYKHSIINTFTTKRKSGNKYGIQRKVDYNVKRPKQIGRIREAINYAWEHPIKNTKLIFVTITTCQHKTGKSDKELMRVMSLWFKNRGGSKSFRYVLTCERQKKTNDLHFHLFVQSDKYFDIKSETKKLSRLLGTEEHPALFDVSKINHVKALTSYITKYITKGCQDSQTKFYCRTYNISHGLLKEMKQNAYKYKLELPKDFTQNYSHLFVQKHLHEFYETYQFNLDIWRVAVAYHIERFNRLRNLPEKIPLIYPET